MLIRRTSYDNTYYTNHRYKQDAGTTMKPVSEPTKKDDECPSCGFKYNGILRCHNMNGECELMNNTKIRPLIESLSNQTTLDTLKEGDV